MKINRWVEFNVEAKRLPDCRGVLKKHNLECFVTKVSAHEYIVRLQGEDAMYFIGTLADILAPKV